MYLFLFLIVLISRWVVAASFMAEKPNEVVVIFVADNTSMCGFGSDGAAALLSMCVLACPLRQSSVCLPLS